METAADASQSPLPVPAARTRRVFASSPGQPRSRRASDVVLLVPSLAALALLVVAYPPSRLERSLSRALQSLPSWLDPLWGAFYDTLALWAVVLVLVALLARRPAVWLQAALSTLVVALASALVGRLALGEWPELARLLSLDADDTSYPVLRVAACASVLLAVGPHLVRPLQTVGHVVLVLGVAGAVLVEQAPPSATAAAVLVSIVAATAVRLALGTSAGHPEPGDVVRGLRELGVAVERLEATARQPAGVFVARGEDTDGRPLLVKVYGRDAYDTQLLEKAWRTALYQGQGTRARLTRIEAVEHEALVTLLARQAGVPTREVVVAAEATGGNALLVLVDHARPLATLPPEELDDARLAQAWAALAALGAAGIAHQRIDTETLAALGDDVGFVELDRARVAPRPEALLVDRAQLLATTAALVGAERAIGAARAALGRDGLAALLPYLQPAAFGTSLRRALRDAGVDDDALREAVASAAEVEPPELVRLRRVTWWSVAQLALLALALSAVVGGLSGLDYDQLREHLAEASWSWIAVGALVAQLPRLTQALSTLGSVPGHLPFGHVYAMQLATGYMNLALPSNLARMAVNIRFFQRQGIQPAVAVTAGTIDSFVSTVMQAILLVVLLLFSGSELEVDLDTPSGPPLRALAIVVALGLAGLVALLAIRRVRSAIADRVRRWWPEVRATLAGVRAGGKLALLLGGSLATELLFAVALGVFANALGFDIGLTDLLLINISVSLLASFLPVPGGIGVAEFGLTVGLTAAGMPEEAALTTAVLYRIATFYLPPLWGFVAMRWLQRSRLL